MQRCFAVSLGRHFELSYSSVPFCKTTPYAPYTPYQM
jgi:hypothetical protein